MYRDDADGGIQGILMDFFIDNEGKIANEFYKIDSEGNFLKVEIGLR